MMRKKIIEKNLRKALLEDGPLALALFEFELQEHIAEYLQSKRDDGDEYFFAVTEHTNDVAMLLIDNQDAVHINEAARSKLKALWRTAYAGNMRKLIPDMAGELDSGHLYVVGVTISQAQG
ncbi:MAG: hypothetical protein HY870_06665 [Chloroflexi bacterium]|nr:hypothetical protein [Chloroflexota bacterium]